MDIKMIEKLKDKLCEELEKISRKSVMSTADLDMVNKLIVSIEKLMKVEDMDEGYSQRMGYSREGMWNAQGNYGRNHSYNSHDGGYNDGSYNDLNSYANRGEHWVRGHYSRAEGSSMVKDHIRKMMDENEINSNDRRILERAMEILD